MISIDRFSVAETIPVSISDVKIDRSVFQPSNSNPSSLVDTCVENVICKPKEILSSEAQETRKRVNSKFGISENLSDLHNALHYVHATFLELENASKSIRLDEVDQDIKLIKERIYATAYGCITTAMIIRSGKTCKFEMIEKLLERISQFQIIFSGKKIENILLARFPRQKDKETRVKGMRESMLRPLDEISTTFQYIQELLNLPSVDLMFIPQEPCLKSEVKDEFTSYINCVENIIKIGGNPIVHSVEGACNLKMVDEFFKLSQSLADLKKVNKENLVKTCNSSVCKNIEIMKAIINYKINHDDESCNQIVVFYHLVLMNVIGSVEVCVNKLLLTKFHISEIASIELSWIWEELQYFDSENSFEKMLKVFEQKHQFIPNTCSKLPRMLAKMACLARLINKDDNEYLFNLIQSFMASNKTIEIWSSIKTVFSSLKQEIAEIKKSMTECNIELQQIIDQTQFTSLEQVDQIKRKIEEFKTTVSPFLFVVFKLPTTLDEFLVEGKDGLFKKSKAKKLNFDTQMNIKDLLNVDFSKIQLPKPEPEIIPVKEPAPKQKAATSKVRLPKPEPKVFQTNRVDDILAELKERGWVKGRYHGSHLIFKKERETFTVPTNNSRLKNGTLSGLNRQYEEKEYRIHERASK